jgi:ribosomal protein S18 acetylase RimI-like enzyme
MAEVKVVDVVEGMERELALFCVSLAKRDAPASLRGAEAKQAWTREMLANRMPFAKLAYVGVQPVGMIQYEPYPDESLVHILCIFVPEREHWQRGIGTQLLTALIEEMNKPQSWNGGRPAAAITTRTFHGESHGQLSAREFFRKRGFQQIGEDPDFLILPLQPGFRYLPTRKPPKYEVQPEDAGVALLIHGPSFCPWAYSFYLQAERLIREAAPTVPIRWIDRAQEPEELRKRGGFTGVVVNGHPLRHSIWDKENFTQEIREALGIA